MDNGIGVVFADNGKGVLISGICCMEELIRLVNFYISKM